MQRPAVPVFGDDARLGVRVFHEARHEQAAPACFAGLRGGFHADDGARCGVGIKRGRHLTQRECCAMLIALKRFYTR